MDSSYLAISKLRPFGFTSRKRGSALITVIIFSAIILLIAAGSVGSVIYQTRSTGRSLAYKQSLALAEAGAEVAMAQLNTTPNTWSGWTVSGANRVISGQELEDSDGKLVGTYSVTVYNADSATPLIDSEGTAQIGTSGPVKRSVRIPVKDNSSPSPFGSYGIYSKNNISAKNSNLKGNSAAEGDIYINVSASRTIGNLQAGGTVDVSKGKTGVTVSDSMPEAPPAFPDDALSAAKLSNGNSTIYEVDNKGNKTLLGIPTSGENSFYKNGEIHFPAGTYFLRSLEIGANTKVVVDGSVTLFIEALDGKMALDFSNGQNGLNAAGKSADLQIFVKSGDMKMGSNFHSYAGIYAPNSNASFLSNTWLTGAIVAKNITLESESGIQTVEELLQPASSAGFLAEAWTEMASN